MRIALERGKPDRVPIAMVADLDFYCKAAGRPLWEFEFGDNAARAAIQRDAHLRFPDNDFTLCWTGVDHETAASRRVVVEDGQPFLEWTATGERTPIQPRKTAAHWSERGGGITSRSGWERPITSEQQIEAALGPVPTVQDILRRGIYDPVAALRRDLGERAYIAVAAHGVFPTALDAMGGFEEGMLALRDRPHLFRAVVEQFALRSAATLQAGARQGADAAWLGGYLEGSDLISPAAWREVVLPGHRLQIEAARAQGLQVLFWFLGDCMPLLRDLVDLGLDGLVVEQPRRGYSSDPVAVRREVGSAFCVYGWNWELDFINDRRENITREVERQVRGAGRDGAFIMGTTYLTSEASLDAVDHFCREVVRVSREVGY
jgi:uroporphyrinogen-III decarboxylase